MQLRVRLQKNIPVGRVLIGLKSRCMRRGKRDRIAYPRPGFEQGTSLMRSRPVTAELIWSLEESNRVAGVTDPRLGLCVFLYEHFGVETLQRFPVIFTAM
jgi:hypothetical protein